MTQKHIYIYSPSGAVRDKVAFRRGLARLKLLGHQVEVDESALASHLRFAGDDETRLAAIVRAAASGADIALISRGGYGLTRLLPKLPCKALARAIDKGMQFVGMSDFTALQCAVLAQTGAVTWAGPSLCEGFGVAGTPDDIMEACFDDLACGTGEGAGWRQDRINPAELSPTQADYTLKEAVLWGGNLSILTSLLGTPYFPNIKGGILFLEDIAEHPYRIERMLTQLLHAGILAKQKAIVLGQFTDYKLSSHDKGFSLKTVQSWLRGQLKIPVLSNLPFGHVPTKVLLPVGEKVKLIVNGRDALLYWG
ncbi:MAG: LD-carboxypeptidase [Burkholderiaceae bacterium]